MCGHLLFPFIDFIFFSFFGCYFVEKMLSLLLRVGWYIVYTLLSIILVNLFSLYRDV